MKLSVELEKWRADRPDEWKMDEFIRNAEKLESERNALAATVEALRKIFPLKVLIGCDAHLNYPVSQYNDMVESFNASPQQHLHDVRAEAIESALDYMYSNTSSGNSVFDDFNLIRDYAERVKAGEK